MSIELNAKEAIRQAFKSRNLHGGADLHDDYKKRQILLTDFDRKNLRVFEVQPGEWDKHETWTVQERRMTDRESLYLDWWTACPYAPERKIGVNVGKYQVSGYTWRVDYGDWMVSLNVDEVNGMVDYNTLPASPSYRPRYDRPMPQIYNDNSGRMEYE